jgi:hypothetical protein
MCKKKEEVEGWGRKKESFIKSMLRNTKNINRGYF